MFARLLESNKNGNRSVWGAFVSTMAHTAAIALAVFATAQARPDDTPSAEVVRWVTPPLAAPVAASAPAAPREQPERALPAPKPAALVIDRIDVVIPPVDVAPAPLPPGPAPLSSGAMATDPRGDPAAGRTSSEPFAADQVERQVYLRPGSAPPRYPNALRAAGIEGQVLVSFVVNEAGRVERSTVRFVSSDAPLFEMAVRDALERMRFSAAEAGGRKVRQLVQMPFVFTLTR